MLPPPGFAGEGLGVRGLSEQPSALTPGPSPAKPGEGRSVPEKPMTRTRWWLAAPGLALALGCADSVARLACTPDTPVMARGQAADRPAAAEPPRKNLWTEPSKPPVTDVPGSPAAHPVLPVTLDAVLRLARE